MVQNINGARPRLKIDAKLIARVEELASQGLTQEQIASCIGCGVSTLYKKKKQIIEIGDAIKRGQHKGVEAVSNALYAKAVKGDNVAMIYYLKCRDPKNWSEVQQHNITSTVKKADESDW